MGSDNDDSWVVVLLLLSIVALFFIPVIFNYQESEKSFTLQWISAIGGVISPISAIYLSYYVFRAQKRSQNIERLKFLKLAVHQEIKAIYDVAYYMVLVKGNYDINKGNEQANIDDEMISKASDISQKFDNLMIWSENDALLKKRIDITTKLNTLKYVINQRSTVGKGEFSYISLSSIDGNIGSIVKNISDDIEAYRKLVEHAAREGGLMKFLGAFFKGIKPPPPSEPTPPPHQTSQP